MKKPIVGLIVQIIAVMFIIGNALEALGSLALFSEFPPLQVISTFALNILLVGLSMWVFMGIQKHSFNTRLPVSLFLWGMLISYPIVNMLRASGLHLPGPEYKDTELMGAAIAEGGRYLFLLFLIVWVGFSKRLLAYFQFIEENSNNSIQPNANASAD